MSDIAIRVENLSKLYRIGQFIGYKSLRESLVNTISAPFRRFHSAGAEPRPKSQNLDSEYIWALKDVSFEVRQGEVLGIIGRNGAGKTTLLRILSHITEPTEGYAEVRGRVGSLLQVGTGFHGELTGRENIYMNGAILGMKKAEIDHKFDDIVAFSEVEKFIDTPVKRYSSGMQVRLAFGVAAHLEPEILLVDEVLAVGDAAFQKKCLGKMGNIAGEGRTVLLVSHRMEAIMGLCSRVIWLDSGRIEADGPADQAVQEYLTAVSSRVELQTSLAERTDRTGNRRLRFTGFQLRDKRGNPINAVVAGDAVDFVLSYVTVGGSVPNVSVWFWIRDSLGRGLLSLRTGLTGDDFEYLPPEGQLICHVPHFPLVPGTYSIDLIASVNAAKADIILSAATLEVIPSDFFGSGKSLHGIGDFLCEHSWKLDEGDS